MSPRAWLWLACIASICSLAACGDDDDTGAPLSRDAGGDSGMDAGQDSGPPGPDSSLPDASKDAEIMDAAIDAGDSAAPDATPPDATMSSEPPDGWTCLATLWADDWCDCGCSEHDVDCPSDDCTEPGCTDGPRCQACFTLEGSWQSCAPEPDPGDWSCDESWRGNFICDCGCGAPDPDCMGEGCSEPGCLKQPACQFRHGCDEAGIDSTDDCSSNNPPDQWACPWGAYGSGDGCDCGCGVPDPDCAGDGCTESRCYDDSCGRCNDEDGRPYSCSVAEGGWDHVSLCDPFRFGAGDGCDCGCGGIDPDCETDDACSEPGCNEDGCDRCTDGYSRLPVGCGVPTPDWDCPTENYGTGDGCDCGCGVPDPDCDGEGSSNPGPLFADACDVCHDARPGLNDFVPCPGWTCGPVSTSPDVYFDDKCDCGCGVIDPRCRFVPAANCTEPGCSMASCEFCNDLPATRTSCGLGNWRSGSTCNIEYYDLDGLCDCGCGTDDPDCGDLGCSEQSCMAPGCDVCHNGTNLLGTCEVWRCDASAFDAGDGVCDCGCGADDPDCEGGGCKEPGCNDLWSDGDPPERACDACHDPKGRVVGCP